MSSAGPNAERRRRAARRWLRAGLGVAALHVALGATGAVLTGVATFVTFFGLCAVLTGVVAAGLWALLRRDPGRGGVGGGGLGSPSAGAPPEGPASGDEPPWWGDFERAFRDYERQARVRS